MDIVQGHNMAPVIPINPNTVETGVCIPNLHSVPC